MPTTQPNEVSDDTFIEPTPTDAERLARVRAAIEAKVKAKRNDYARPRPLAGRHAQELDSEALGPQIRENRTTLSGPHYPRVPSR